MPTPHDEHDETSSTPTLDISTSSATHATCPPEDRSTHAQSENNVLPTSESSRNLVVDSAAQMPTPEEDQDPEPMRMSEPPTKPMDLDEDPLSKEARLPIPSSPVNDDTKETEPRVTPPTSVQSSPTHSSYPLSRKRLIPCLTSSFFQSGSKFRGTQQSDRQTYDVQVEIKHVDMEESFVCGYLRIQGLTDDHPTLTTYFEGEIIGTKHSFRTSHPEWGSTEKVDMQHWARFPPWKPLAKHAKSPNFACHDYAQREHLFMRWKEYFLVPDHKVKSITGASFEGFYYICFNQRNGSVSGIYFHSRSEKYQQLELVHVEDRGCVGAVEFR
ncbi:hypothetical protein E4T50_14026 [Aureobasidium sp. EXF-12298]|nr:hypothetical protein E4T50_14026 [Aureobasidium sp. EXF-12298]